MSIEIIHKFVKQKYETNLNKEGWKIIIFYKIPNNKNTDKSFDGCSALMDRIIQWVGLSPSEVLIILLR